MLYFHIYLRFILSGFDNIIKIIYSNNKKCLQNKIYARNYMAQMLL
ncbi:Hypothetical protein BN2458_PEG0133 [Helicobacter typhlonius]|uniref:Uncharacterized protein n=1 Tax=Helicobacter typhlonius TaxID=76936 RepID=A0A0S4PSK3_9HELI|nr:Hypothetical protein BN2458_PEG0133 [Helicobacter typhlonius]